MIDLTLAPNCFIVDNIALSSSLIPTFFKIDFPLDKDAANNARCVSLFDEGIRIFPLYFFGKTVIVILLFIHHIDLSSNRL